MLKFILGFFFHFSISHSSVAGPSGSVGCASASHADGRGLDPRVRQHSFMEIGYEIISTANLPLPLIQVGQLSIMKGYALSTG